MVVNIFLWYNFGRKIFFIRNFFMAEGKDMLRSHQVGERRRFFDGKHNKNASFEDVQVKKDKQKIKKNKKEDRLEGIEKLASREDVLKFLKNTLKEEFKRKIEKENITNTKGKPLLNEEISALTLLIGKDFLDDEFIVNDIADSQEKENFFLNDAYAKKIEQLLETLSVSQINELLFDFHINGEIEKEIAKLKKAAKEIYQGRVRELSNGEIFDLKKKVLDELDKASRVKEDYLALKERKKDAALNEDQIDELRSIIHSTIMEEVLIDEVSIPLKVTNKEIEDENIKEENMTGQEVVEIKKQSFASPVSAQEEVGSSVEVEEEKNKYKYREIIDIAISQCNEKEKLLIEKFEKLKEHAVIYEEEVEMTALEEEMIVPITRKFESLKEYLGADESEMKKNIKDLEFIKEKMDAVIDNIDLLIKNHYLIHHIAENAGQVNEKEDELKWDKKTFERAVEFMRKQKMELVADLEENDYWLSRKNSYKASILQAELKNILDDVIKKKGLVEGGVKEEFIQTVLSEVLSDDEAPIESTEDGFNKLLNSVKI